MNRSGPSFPRSLLLAGSAVVAVWVAHAVAREVQPPGAPLRIALVGILIAAVSVAVAIQVRLAASLDEFTRHVQFRALSIAFPISVVAAFAIGFLAAEGLFAGADPRDLPAVMIASYAVGLAFAFLAYVVPRLAAERTRRIAGFGALLVAWFAYARVVSIHGWKTGFAWRSFLF